MQSRIFNISLLLVLLGSIVLAICAIQWQWFLQHPMNIPAAGLEYQVPQGMSASSLAQDLANKGLIDKPRFFLLLVRTRGQETQIKSGEYFIQAETTPGQWLTQLVKGDVIQHPIRIGEGWTFNELRDMISRSVLVATTAGVDNEQLMAIISDGKHQHPEGLFFPDTYFVAANTKDIDFLSRAYQRMMAVLDEQWQQRADNLPYKTPYEALIMSSIVEKETGIASERATIAGVLVRRLQRNMLLQVDPTVIYGLGNNFNGDLTKTNLKIDTPYNTYLHHGLPTTPIALPSLASIKAALHPEAGDTLYFVAKGDGSHVFSSTLAEHNRAVKAYIRQLSKKKHLGGIASNSKDHM